MAAALLVFGVGMAAAAISTAGLIITRHYGFAVAAVSVILLACALLYATADNNYQ